MHICTSILGFPAVLAAACAAAFAQAPAPAPVAVIAADSPLLYRLFFRFHLDFDQWLAARKSASPSSAAALDSGAASLLGLRATELNTLSSVTQSMAANLGKIDRDEAAYVNSGAKREQRPEAAVLGQYRRQREAAIAAGMAELRQRLPADSFAALLGFINGRFRAAHRTAAQP